MILQHVRQRGSSTTRHSAGGLDMPPKNKPVAIWVAFLTDISFAQLFAGVFIVGFANGIAAHIHSSIQNDGLGEAIVATFDISILVWAAFWICPACILQARRQKPNRLDWIVAILAFVIFALPLAPCAWIALTGVALYLLRGSASRSRSVAMLPVHASALILLATTASMFWGHLLLSLAGRPILSMDAQMVGWATGAGHVGNTVPLSDGSGFLWIAPGCSSLSGISLTLLCWLLFAQVRAIRWSFGGMLWCGLGCLAVVTVNVVRISGMVLVPELFDVIHGPVGGMLANWLSLGLLLVICNFGTRRAAQLAA